ncbi:MAG: hypothetical protein ACP5E8_00870 [Thermoplasmata archaeon]
MQRIAVTYSYGDLLPVMKAVRDLNLEDILGRILGENATTVLIMTMNRVIRPEAMDLLEEWYDDSYISTIYPVSLSSSTLSRVMKAVGSIEANRLYLKKYSGLPAGQERCTTILHHTHHSHATWSSLSMDTPDLNTISRR